MSLLIVLLQFTHILIFLQEILFHALFKTVILNILELISLNILFILLLELIDFKQLNLLLQLRFQILLLLNSEVWIILNCHSTLVVRSLHASHLDVTNFIYSFIQFGVPFFILFALSFNAVDFFKNALLFAFFLRCLKFVFGFNNFLR